MAEKATSAHTFAVTLTYNDDTQRSRDGAAMFQYADIRLFLANLRDAIKYKTKKTAALRFIACGEQGDQFGRCHWHIILFSDVDLLEIGKYKAAYGPVTTRQEIVTTGKEKKRLHWSPWPHGYVVVQEPDEGGIKYAISYALKDQFSVVKSKDTMREAKAETFSAGMFRMSKSPPIGLKWVEERIYDLYCSGAVRPSLAVNVEDQSGYWYLSGAIRETFLIGMRRINDSCLAQYGHPAPQWSSLLAHCKDNEQDIGVLLNVKEEQEDPEHLELEIKLAIKEQAQATIDRGWRQRCGSTLPCSHCLNSADAATLALVGLERSFDGQYSFTKETGDQIHILQADCARSAINPACCLQDTKPVKRVFPQSAGRSPFA